jgi:hypothetical protein
VQVGNYSRFFAVPSLRGFFASNLLIAFVAWVLAWACAVGMRISSIDAVRDQHRRFPPPWIVEELETAFVVKDGIAQKPIAIQFSVTPVTFAMKITR